MAKPRIFLSSTCIDLRDARAAIKAHLESLGFEVLASDSKDFGVSAGKHSHDACIAEVDNADFLVLVVGGQHGGTYVGSEKSITNEEWSRAMKRGIPVFNFVKREVYEAADGSRKNKKADYTHVVSDTRILQFVQSISARSKDNWIHTFDTVEDIKARITTQCAHMLLDYSKNSRVQSKAAKDGQSAEGVAPFPAALAKIEGELKDEMEKTALINGLRNVHKTIQAIQTAEISSKSEQLKLLWLFGRYGDQGYGGTLTMNAEVFKDRAWGPYRGQRVFQQLRPFGVEGTYSQDSDGDDGGATVEIEFENKPDDTAFALKRYVECLLADGDEDLALERFRRADMSVFA